MSEKFCQSCGMPMTAEDFGTNKDGSLDEDYCRYCYVDGAFTTDSTLEEMIDICVKYMVKPGEGMTEESARALLQEQLPKLKRWQNA